MTGVSQYIKGCPEFGLPALKRDLLTIAVEPQEQMLLTEAKGGKKRGEQGPHKVSFLKPAVLQCLWSMELKMSVLKIQGMGAGIIPGTIDLGYVDEVVAVHSDAAMETCNELWLEGIPVGISSGAIVNAAVEVCKRPENAGKVITNLCSSCRLLDPKQSNTSMIIVDCCRYNPKLRREVLFPSGIRRIKS